MISVALTLLLIKTRDISYGKCRDENKNATQIRVFRPNSKFKI